MSAIKMTRSTVVSCAKIHKQVDQHACTLGFVSNDEAINAVMGTAFDVFVSSNEASVRSANDTSAAPGSGNAELMEATYKLVDTVMEKMAVRRSIPATGR